jgi:hypothetical protein
MSNRWKKRKWFLKWQNYIFMLLNLVVLHGIFFYVFAIRWKLRQHILNLFISLLKLQILCLPKSIIHIWFLWIRLRNPACFLQSIHILIRILLLIFLTRILIKLGIRNCIFSHLNFINLLKLQKKLKNPKAMRFELTRGYPIGFQVQRLNHSATLPYIRIIQETKIKDKINFFYLNHFLINMKFI